MNDRFPLRVIAEILTKATPEEKRDVLSRYDQEQADWQKFVIKHDLRTLHQMDRQQMSFAMLPWWKRIGKHYWDMSEDE